MNVLLYRRSLALKSGTSHLMLMQARGLEAAGARVGFGGQRARLKLALHGGRYARRLTLERAREIARGRRFLFVDHQAAVPEADIVFVHNLGAALAEAIPAGVAGDVLAAEAEFFQALTPGVPVIANSRLVRDGLQRLFGLERNRVAVHYPGFDSARFGPAVRERSRAQVRAMLGITDEAPLIGLITSGDLRKRGIDLFFAAAERIRAARRNARFLIVGSKRLPDDYLRHDLVRAGALLHRPKDGHPERWYSALDVFLYPAHYEEFGLVVSEAQAMGIPVVVSGRVGAAECLPDAYREWGLPALDAGRFAAKALELLEDRALAKRLVAAALVSIADHDGMRYGAATAAAILAQKRRLR